MARLGSTLGSVIALWGDETLSNLLDDVFIIFHMPIAY